MASESKHIKQDLYRTKIIASKNETSQIQLCQHNNFHETFKVLILSESFISF